MSDPEKMLSYSSPSPLLAHGELFRDGALLVVHNGATLPKRCILCGEVAATDRDSILLNLSWDSSFKRTQHSTLELGQSGSVHIFLCTRHRRQWMLGRFLGFVGVILSAVVMLAGLIVAIVSENTDIPRYTADGIIGLIVGFALLITSLFIYTLRTKTVSCVKIDRGFLHLDGVGARFLDGFAQVPDIEADHR